MCVHLLVDELCGVVLLLLEIWQQFPVISDQYSVRH